MEKPSALVASIAFPSTTALCVVGFAGCPFYDKAAARVSQAPGGEEGCFALQSRAAFQAWLARFKSEHGATSSLLAAHTTSPACFYHTPAGKVTWVGTCDDLLYMMSAESCLAPLAKAPDREPVRIFVAGDKSQVGKSTVCLGLLGSLLARYDAADLAYIKPATQCEQPQLVAKFCARHGIACVPIGPVVFYAGFTRAFLKGQVGTSEDLLQAIDAAVHEVSRGRKVVIVDGVGYPAVGSICGISNAAVAARLQAPVLLVGKRGVGDAIDSYNLNCTFFSASRVPVLGAVFNRFETEGYYAIDKAGEAIESYFSQYGQGRKAYGFLPVLPQLESSAATAPSVPAPRSAEEAMAAAKVEAPALNPSEAAMCEALVEAFQSAVDVDGLLRDAQDTPSTATASCNEQPGSFGQGYQAVKRLALPAGADGAATLAAKRSKIQGDAKASGAAGG